MSLLILCFAQFDIFSDSLYMVFYIERLTCWFFLLLKYSYDFIDNTVCCSETDRKGYNSSSYVVLLASNNILGFVRVVQMVMERSSSTILQGYFQICWGNIPLWRLFSGMKDCFHEQFKSLYCGLIIVLCFDAVPFCNEII